MIWEDGLRNRSSLILFLLLLSPPYLGFSVPNLVSASASQTETAQQPAGQPLPPGTIAYQNTWKSPPNGTVTFKSSGVMQTQDANFRISPHEVNVARGYRYVGPRGNWTWNSAQPYLFTYTDLWGNKSVKFSVATIKTASGFALPVRPVAHVSQTGYSVSYEEHIGPLNCGSMTVAFSPGKWKANFTFAPSNGSPCGDFHIAWLNVGRGNYLSISPTGDSYQNANATSSLTSLGNATGAYLAAKASGNRVSAKIDWSSHGVADVRYGSVVFGTRTIHAMVVIFPLNVAEIDPSVTQRTSNTCYGCSSLTVSFPGPVTAGNMIVLDVTWNIANGNTPNPTVIDTRGDTYQTATNGLTGGSGGSPCDGYSYYCAVWIGYASSIASSGSNTISITMNGYPAGNAYAGVGVYELSGYTSSGLQTSTNYCGGSGCSMTMSVTSYTPAANSFVVAAGYWGACCAGSASAGAAYTKNMDCGAGGTCLDMYSTSISGSTTAPMTIPGSSSPVWTAASASFPPRIVTQPVTATLSSGSQQAISASGCSVSPTSFAGDGAPHSLSAFSSCTLTLSLPPDYKWSSTGSPTRTVTTCPSGTCSGSSDSYFYGGSVSQPLTATPIGTTSPQTITASGCGASPGSFTGDGSSHALSASASCTMTLYLPPGYTWSSTSSQTTSVTTCPSGTCAGYSDSYFFSDAASSTQSWSKPGLSPYQGYFASLNEYVSPGNGLLGIGQSDLYLPGRGLDLGIARVFSTPYAFRAGSPYVYDNYSLSNLGYGWSLDFPWLGTNYFHLPGGQAYPYSWSGSTSGTVSPLSVAYSYSGPYTTSNLVADSGFESGGSSGVWSSSNCGWSSASYPHTGTYSFAENPNCSTSQTITLPSGVVITSMTASAWFIEPSHIQTSYDVGYLTMVAAGCSQSQSSVLSGSWTQITVSLTCNPQSSYVTLTLGTGRGCTLRGEDRACGSVYIDDASLAVTYTSSISGSVSSGTNSYSTFGSVVTYTYSLSYGFPGGTTSKQLQTTIPNGQTFVSLSGGSCGTLSSSQYTLSGTTLTIPDSTINSCGSSYTLTTQGPATPQYEAVFEYHKAVDFILANNGNGYTFYAKSGTLYQFDVNKRLVSIADRTGSNVITFSYGGNNYISQITDTIGRVVTLSYTNNQLTSITSGTRTWTYGYSGNNLVSVTDPNNRVTTYQYGSTAPPGISSWLISAVLYPTGGKSTYTYGSAPVNSEVSTYYVTLRNIYYSPTALSQSSSISYNLVNGNPVWSNATVSDGTSIQSYQNSNFQSTNNLVKLYDKSSTGALIRVTEHDYDSSGRISQTKLYSPTNALLASSQTDYDSWGNVKHARDSLGHDAYFSYANTDSQNTFGATGFSNSFYSPLAISANIHSALLGEAEFQNGPGTATMEAYFKYDSSGNLLEQKLLHAGSWLLAGYTYDSYGNKLSVTDALGRTAYLRYSSTYSFAYLTKQSIMAGTQNVTTTYTYDPATGYLLSQTDPNGFATSNQYDILGRVTQTTFPAVGGVTAFVQYGYDDVNNILTATDEKGNMTKQYFDGLARPTRVERYNGSALYSSETYTNNWVNQVATKTTATGNTYSYSYDSDGRLTKVTNPDSTFSTISYDDLNNIKTVTDENGHQKQHLYDWANRLTAVREYYGPSNYLLTSFTHDQVGNLLSVTDAKNNVTSYQYDDLNRLTQTTYPDGTVETRTYDNVGNLLARTDPRNNQISYSYDALNRLTKVTYPDATSVSYSYDANGNRLSMTDPSSSTYYTYDARNRLTNETKYVSGTKYSLLYSYDRVGNIVSMTYPDTYTLSFTYDAFNRVRKLVGTGTTYGLFAYTLDDKIKTIAYGNGEVATYSYDSRSRPTRILVMSGITKRMDLNYTYDGSGNVLGINNENYGYDPLDRITSSSYTGGWGDITYTYDGAGNRLTMTQGGATTTYSYGRFNRLTKAVTGSSTVTYAYDANGNLATKNDGVYQWSYTYDYDNRLTRVQRGNTTMEQMVYDGDGKAIQNVQANTVVSIWVGFDIIYQSNLGTGLVTKYFMANGLRVGYMAGSAVYYYHQDILGSPRLISTSTAGTQFSSNYIPYGPNYGASGTEVFQFTGKPLDSITGYYNFGARYYDPDTGRFITQDSYPGVREDGQSLNRYVYARNNPERLIDPNGHDWLSAFTGALSNAAGSVAASVSGAVSAATNAWNSLPPPVQTAVVVTAVTVAIVATGGAAAPALLAGAFMFGGLNAGTSVALDVLSGGPVNVNGAFSSFGAGFALGGIAMMAEMGHARWVSGKQSELRLQRALAKEGIETERGWSAITRSDRVQLDLVDLKNGGVYESKSNFVDQIYPSPVTKLDQAERQAALIGNRVDLVNPSTGAVIPDFCVSSVTWCSVARGGTPGFHEGVQRYLSDLGIMMRTIE